MPFNYFKFFFIFLYLILIFDSSSSFYLKESRCSKVNTTGLSAEINSNTTRNGYEVKYIGYELARKDCKTYVYGHYVKVYNPLEMLSVVEPGGEGGCGKRLNTVQETAIAAGCDVAMNAGFFGTRTQQCLGNIITSGKLILDNNGIPNAHFGIKKDGKLFFGFITPEQVNSGEFQQLIGGVIWLRYNNTSFINSSQHLECEKTQETGTLNVFTDIISARTVLGSDSDGNVVLIQVVGKSKVTGISLWEMESLLDDLNITYAINLDGGGSATMVINGTIVNYPSDNCDDNNKFHCPRKVSTIICIKSKTDIIANETGVFGDFKDTDKLTSTDQFKDSQYKNYYLAGYIILSILLVVSLILNFMLIYSRYVLASSSIYPKVRMSLLSQEPTLNEEDVLILEH